MFTLLFWKATLERVISSVAGGALAVIGSDVFGVLDADWKAIASVALGAGLVSLLKGLAAGKITGTGPGLGSAEVLTEQVVAVEPDPAGAPGEYEAGPAAPVPAGEPVEVAPVGEILGQYGGSVRTGVEALGQAALSQEVDDERGQGGS